MTSSFEQEMELPFVSIIMPVRNEGSFIETSLNAVLQQDYPRYRMEIIVVDGMSNDSTREIVKTYQSRYPYLHLVDNPGKIAPTGLNAGFAHAQGEIIARVDGHCEIASDYIRRCVEHITKEKVDGVGGPMVTIGETYLASLIAQAMSSPFGVGDSAFRTSQGQSIFTDTIPFPVYTRKIMERAGPYDEELVRNQDDEYNYRLRKLGSRLLLAADVKSRYYSRGSLRSLWRQYFQYGYWKVRVMQKHPRQMRPRQFIPLAFVTTLIGFSILGIFISWIRLLFLIVTGSYALVNIIASTKVAYRHSFKNIALLSLIFAILHLSYGLGFLIGLFKFANCWNNKNSLIYQDSNA